MTRAGQVEDLGIASPNALDGRLSRVLVSLASNPEAGGVPKHLASAGCENLVVEFDEAYTAFVDGFERLPSETQMIALQAMDMHLAKMVRAQDATLWTEKAHREDPAWHEVRALARHILLEFDGPNQGTDGRSEPRA